MYHLVYTSKATENMEDGGLIKILETSRRNNALLDITGLLLYRDGHFLQVLEGPREAVLELYETIKADERHTNVKTLMEGDTAGREFGDWEMGFKDITHATEGDLEGVSLFMEGKFDPEQQQALRSRVWAFLEVFRGIAAGS